MAERDYKRGEGITPIQEMTTRQLRKYIRERAEEAQERLTSIQNDKRLNIEDMSRAFQDQLPLAYCSLKNEQDQKGDQSSVRHQLMQMSKQKKKQTKKKKNTETNKRK